MYFRRVFTKENFQNLIQIFNNDESTNLKLQFFKKHSYMIRTQNALCLNHFTTEFEVRDIFKALYCQLTMSRNILQ